MMDGEQKLIQSAIRGEASAFGLLYDQYQPMIYRFILVKTSRREEAEDLTHQVFLNAWQNIGTYRDTGHPFSSWLYRIARNLVIDYYRTKKKQVSIDEIDPDIFSTAPNHEIAMEQKLQFAKVTKAILLLKQEHQDIIIMRFMEELSHKEIAAALGKSEGSVKLLQYRAIQNLKKILEA